MAQQPLARVQRQRTHVAAVGVQQVEDVVRDGDTAAPGDRGIGDPHAPLQPAEARLPVLVERDHLTVQHDVVHPIVLQRVDDLGIRGIELTPIAREQAHVGTDAERETAHAVELALEEQPSAEKC